MKYYFAVAGVALLVTVLILNYHAPIEDIILHPALIDDIRGISIRSPIVSDFIKNNPDYDVFVEPIGREDAENIIGIGPWDREVKKTYYKLTYIESQKGLSVIAIVDWTDRTVAFTKAQKAETSQSVN